MGDVTKSFVGIMEIFGDTVLARIAGLGLFIVIIGSTALVWNSLTGDFTLRRIEGQINLLSQLHELDKDDIGSNSELDIIYTQLVDQLREYNPNVVPVTYSAGLQNINSYHVAGGMGIWLWFALFFARASGCQTIIISIIFGIISSIFVNIFVPPSYNTVLDVVLGVIFQFLVLVCFALIASLPRFKQQNPTNNEISPEVQQD